MSKHINGDSRPLLVPPADAMNTALKSVEEARARAQRSIEELRAAMQKRQAEVDAMVAALRRKAEELPQRAQEIREAERARRRKLARKAAPPPSPPPIVAFLTGFVGALNEKVQAIAAALPPSDRERVRAIAPGFTRAVIHDEPDVRALVGMLLQVDPDVAALFISTCLPDFERRFAS
jgi:hypothetical protein